MIESKNLLIDCVFRLYDHARSEMLPTDDIILIDDPRAGEPIVDLSMESRQAMIEGAPDGAVIIFSKLSDTKAIEGEPCPFCGSADIHNWSSDDHDPGNQSWSVMCYNCECEGPHCTDEKEAIDRWNRRA